MANLQKTEGIVLYTKPFKESSMICSILTKKFGKLKILAKGGRRPRSKFCGTLEPFSLDEIIFYKREYKEIYTLSDAVIKNSFEDVRAQAQKVNAGMVLCEFFDKTLAAEETNEDSFRFLLNFLMTLQNADESSIKPLTYSFLLRALSGAGIRPHLENCVRCRAPIVYAHQTVDFSIGAGGVVCNKDFDDTVIFLSGKTIKIFNQIYSNRSFEIDDTALREIERLIPDYLCYHLNNLTLNSLKYLR